MIRSLGPDDRAAAVALWHACGLTRPWNAPEADFDRAVAGPTSTVLGLFDDGSGALLATAMVGHDGHRGWVYYVAASPDRQGAGLGRQLIAGAEQWLRDAGAVKVQLMVRHTNLRAIGFYELLGYEDADVTVLAKWL